MNIVELFKKAVLEGTIPVWLILLLFLAKVVWDIIKNIDSVEKVYGKFYKWLSSYLNLRTVKKNAVKYDLQGRINSTVNKIREELPEKNIRNIELEYVSHTEEEAFINEGKIYVRVRPLENQEDNFLNITQLYLEFVLVPNTRRLLGDYQKNAITYYTMYRMVDDDDNLLKKLNEELFLPSVKRDNRVQEYFNDILDIDSHGFFYSIVLRSIENAVNKNRFTGVSLENEFQQVINHVKTFVLEMRKNEISEANWINITGFNIYAILLVARPYNYNPHIYIRRMLKDLKKAEVVFAVFSKAEWDKFGKRVAKIADNHTSLELLKTINTNYDYRGQQGGTIKVYCRKSESEEVVEGNS